MRPTIRNSRTGSDADQSTKPNVVAGPNEVRPAGVATPDTPEDAPPSLSGGVGTQRFDRASTSVGCCRPQEPSRAVRSKQAACDVRGPAHCRARDLRLSLKVQRRRSRGWAWRSLSASYSPTGPIRCGGCQASVSVAFSALGLTCAYRLCLAGLASCPVQREGGAAHRRRCVHSFVPFRRGSGWSPGAASSRGRRSPVRHGARVSIAAVCGRDCVGVCFGQLTRATRLPEPCSAPTDPLPGPSPSPIRNKHIGAATLTPNRSRGPVPATRA